MNSDNDMSMIVLLRVVVSRWKLIALTSIIMGITCVALSFLVPDTYRSQAKIIPSGILSSNKNIGDADLLSAARSMGFNFGSAGIDPSSLIPEILNSDDFARQLLRVSFVDSDDDTVSLLERLSDESDPDRRESEASKTLRVEVLDSSFDVKSGVTSVYITTNDPVLSAEIARECVLHLNEFNSNIRMSQASREEEFIAGRLTDVKASLENAEQDLLVFRESNWNYQASPRLQLDESRLKRAVQAYQDLYILLRRQMEMSGFDKLRSVPLLRVIETPRAPIEHHSPRRGLLGFGGACLGLFAAILYVLYIPGMRALFHHDSRIGPS